MLFYYGFKDYKDLKFDLNDFEKEFYFDKVKWIVN